MVSQVKLFSGFFGGALKDTKKHFEINWPLKFVYSEKATKFCKISTLLLCTVHTDKSKGEISQNYLFELYLPLLRISIPV